MLEKVKETLYAVMAVCVIATSLTYLSENGAHAIAKFAPRVAASL